MRVRIDPLCLRVQVFVSHMSSGGLREPCKPNPVLYKESSTRANPRNEAIRAKKILSISPIRPHTSVMPRQGSEHDSEPVHLGTRLCSIPLVVRLPHEICEDKACRNPKVWTRLYLLADPDGEAMQLQLFVHGRTVLRLQG